MTQKRDETSPTAPTEQSAERAGSSEARGWRVSADQERTPDAPKPKPSLWDRSLHLMGVIGPDKRGGPGG